MSHEIDVSTGRAACMTVGDPPWHGLGVTIESAATSAEAIELARLNWAVEQWPLFTRPEATLLDGVQPLRTVPDRVANVRTDTGGVLGVVSPQYRVFQNSEAFDFMDSLVGEKLAMYHTAGALRGGKRVWMLAKIPKEYRVGDDVVEAYALITNSHDATQSLRVLPTTVRVVCQNTLTYALGVGQGQGLAIRHRPNLEDRVNEAREKLGIIGERLDRFGEEMQALAGRSLSAKESLRYFEGLFPTTTKPQARPVVNTDGLLDQILDAQAEHTEVIDDLLAGHYAATEAQAKRNGKILDAVVNNYENERNTLPEIRHTAWSAYNAVSEYTDHQAKSRGKTDAQRADNRLNSIWFGAGNETKQRAYSNALALVQ